ncbi:hypothetical protein GCM10008938_49300 [Deinococcus roseus]|uniref:Uncharacterized protein n=1 Tax=Deinococcus roseus TaxID=392414 RepID=A0ABQ2DGQ6_9DEIO|nr:hypothetical protein GCM10008938_49300 [Deinococcus roseus]
MKKKIAVLAVVLFGMASLAQAAPQIQPQPDGVKVSSVSL